MIRGKWAITAAITGVALVVLWGGESRESPLRGSRIATPGNREVGLPNRGLQSPGGRTEVPIESRSEVTQGWSLLVVDDVGTPLGGAHLMMAGSVVLTSDHEGHLTCDSTLTSTLLEADHDLLIARAGFVTAALRPGDVGSTNRIVLRRGWSLDLQVSDPDGIGIPGAACAIYDSAGNPLLVEWTGLRGSALIRDICNNPVRVEVRAAGYASWQTEFVAGSPWEEYLDVQLREGAVLEVRVTDSKGAPVQGASVVAREVVLHSGSVSRDWTGLTDRRGVTVLSDLPAEGSLQVESRAPGHASSVRTFLASPESLEQGMDLILASVAELEVAVRDPMGRPMEAKVSIDVWQTRESSQRDGQVLSQASEGVPITDRAGTYLVEQVPSGPTVTVYAQIGGALVGSQRGISLTPGERRRVTVVVPEHLKLDLRIEGRPCPGGTVRLRALDGRLGESTAPPWAQGGRRPISYRAEFDRDCRAAMFLTRGLYRLTIRDDAGQMIHARDWTVDAGGEAVVELAEARNLSGRLVDHEKQPLAGWTVIARSPTGIATSTRTALDGNFRMEGFGADIADLYTLIPQTLHSLELASRLELPSSGSDYQVESSSLVVRLLDFESGEQLTGTARVKAMSFDGLQLYRSAHPDGSIASAQAPTYIEVAPGAIRLTGSDQAFEKSGRISLSLHPGESVSVDLILTRDVLRRFETTGLEVGDVVRWSASKNGRGTTGQFFTMGNEIVESNFPDGPVRFVRVREGRVAGPAIDMVVGSGPIALHW